MKTNNEKKPRFNFADKRENISGGRRDGNRNENANNRFKRHGDDETPRFNHFNKDRNNQSYNRNNDGEQRQSGYQHKPYGNYNRHENNDERPYKRSYQTDRERNNNYDPNKVYSKKKQFEYKKQYIDYSKPMRLNKFIANSGLCSRREADEYIAAGVISVNGKVVTELGIKIIPNTDRVLFHDQLVRSEKKVYILLNKPKNCVTTSATARTSYRNGFGKKCLHRKGLSRRAFGQKHYRRAPYYEWRWFSIENDAPEIQS